MIRRDYIMKLLQQMIEALFLLMNKKDLTEEEKKNQLQSFYLDYLGEDNNFYHSSSFDEILDFLGGKYGDELILRVEILSEIMYNEAILEENEVVGKELQQRALIVLEYLEANSNTYSITRQGKIDTIKQLLSK